MRSNMAKDGARIVGDANDLLTGLCTQVGFLFLVGTPRLLAREFRCGVLESLF